jgi:hypothetical protein
VTMREDAFPLPDAALADVPAALRGPADLTTERSLHKEPGS